MQWSPLFHFSMSSYPCFLTCICLMAGVPTAMTLLHDLQTKFFYIMSQRDNTMRIRWRATLEYVKRIDATRYIAPCICHIIRHIHGNDVIPLREVWYVIFVRHHFQKLLSRKAVVLRILQIFYNVCEKCRIHFTYSESHFTLMFFVWSITIAIQAA